jgi:hypothetical protein
LGDPKIDSTPNHVAKKAAVDMKNGRFPPAMAKSSPVFTRLEARNPIKTVNAK